MYKLIETYEDCRELYYSKSINKHKIVDYKNGKETIFTVYDFDFSTCRFNKPIMFLSEGDLSKSLNLKENTINSKVLHFDDDIKIIKI